MSVASYLATANRTPWEGAVAAASATRRPVDADIIRRIWDPWSCPTEFLPALAQAFGVKLWIESWPEARKRSMIANAIELRRLEGTLPGIERYLPYVDASLRTVTLPSAKVFSGASLTREAREAWLAKLPQVRIYRERMSGTAGLRIFSGGRLYKSFLEGRFPYPSDAANRAAPRAVWVVDGVETDARVEQLDAVTIRVFRPGVRPLAVFSGLLRARAYFLPSTAATRIVTITPVANSPWRQAVGTALAPVTAEPELVVQSARPRQGVFGGPIFRRFFLPSTAATRVFRRYAVNDGSVPVRSPAIQFMGLGRYGFPAHTAELAITVRGRKRSYAAGEGAAAPHSRFWTPHDGGPLDRVLRAVRAWKRRSDVILVDTKTPVGFVAGQILLAGGTFRAT